MDDGKEHIPLWKKGSGYESPGLDYMRKIASGQIEVGVPIAVLKEDPRRHILLQNGRIIRHSSEIVFADIRFPVNAPAPITSQLESPHVVAVVFDLKPRSPTYKLGPWNSGLILWSKSSYAFA